MWLAADLTSVRSISGGRARCVVLMAAGAIAYWTVVAFVVMTVLMCPMAVILFFARDAIAVIFSQPAHISAAVRVRPTFRMAWRLLLRHSLRGMRVHAADACAGGRNRLATIAACSFQRCFATRGFW